MTENGYEAWRDKPINEDLNFDRGICEQCRQLIKLEEEGYTCDLGLIHADCLMDFLEKCLELRYFQAYEGDY